MLGAAVAILCLKGALLDRARRIHLDPALPRAVEARWGSLTEWDVFDRTPVAVRAWRISSQGGPATERLSRPLPPESALVTASRSLDTVKNFLRAHELGFPVEAVENEDHGDALVGFALLLGDCGRDAHDRVRAVVRRRVRTRRPRPHAGGDRWYWKQTRAAPR